MLTQKGCRQGTVLENLVLGFSLVFAPAAVWWKPGLVLDLWGAGSSCIMNLNNGNKAIILESVRPSLGYSWGANLSLGTGMPVAITYFTDSLHGPHSRKRLGRGAAAIVLAVILAVVLGSEMYDVSG
ncbi:hypothetical protein B0T21DRAFT_352738 [Apiosordaria backusii]|uniref:Uncharacterized protein n=1 Tax=Apiosordaria backusii TaxID=314023 RepID=A0AA40A749_9PEZI|nr:hypothetical protein B0T21DRAFT_352738 [Apiosordaria backusii]